MAQKAGIEEVVSYKEQVQSLYNFVEETKSELLEILQLGKKKSFSILTFNKDRKLFIEKIDSLKNNYFNKLEELMEKKIFLEIESFFEVNYENKEVKGLFLNYLETKRLAQSLSEIFQYEFSNIENIKRSQLDVSCNFSEFIIQNNSISYNSYSEIFFITEFYRRNDKKYNFLNLFYDAARFESKDDQETFYYYGIKQFNDKSKELRLAYLKEYFSKSYLFDNADYFGGLVVQNLNNLFGDNSEFLVEILADNTFIKKVSVDQNNLPVLLNVPVNDYIQDLGIKMYLLERLKVLKTSEERKLWNYEVNSYSITNFEYIFTFEEAITDILNALSVYDAEIKKHTNFKEKDIFLEYTYKDILNKIVTENKEELEQDFNLNGKTLTGVIKILTSITGLIEQEFIARNNSDYEKTFLNSSFMLQFKLYFNFNLLFKHLYKKWAKKDDVDALLNLMEYEVELNFAAITMNQIFTKFELKVINEVKEINQKLKSKFNLKHSELQSKEYLEYKEQLLNDSSNKLNEMYNSAYKNVFFDVQGLDANNCTWLLANKLEELLYSFSDYVAFGLANGILKTLTFPTTNLHNLEIIKTQNFQYTQLDFDILDFKYLLNLMYNHELQVRGLNEFLKLYPKGINTDILEKNINIKAFGNINELINLTLENYEFLITNLTFVKLATLEKEEV